MKAFFSKKPKAQPQPVLTKSSVPVSNPVQSTSPFQQLNTMAVSKKQLGPGFTCELQIQNQNGTNDESIHHGQTAKSLKLLKLTSVKRDSQPPELFVSIKNNKGPQDQDIIVFVFEQIHKIHAQCKQQGKLTIQIVNGDDAKEMQEQKKKAKDMPGKSAAFFKKLPLKTILLSGMTPEHVDALLNHFQTHQKELKSHYGIKEIEPMTQQPKSNQDIQMKVLPSQQLTKKRTIGDFQRTNGQLRTNLIINNKHRKMNDSINNVRKPAQISQTKVVSNTQAILQNSQQTDFKSSARLSDIPWDCLRIIIDFFPLNDNVLQKAALNTEAPPPGVKLYKSMRLISRDFYRLISSKRVGLLFQNKSITERVFFDLISKAAGGSQTTIIGRTPLTSRIGSKNLQQFGILTTMPAIKATTFNKYMRPMNGLLQLDLSKFSTGLGETGLNRLLMGCRSTLEYVSLPYNSREVSQAALSTIGTMSSLTSIHLGNSQTFHKLNDSTTKLSHLKHMFRIIKQSKKMKLKILSVYECDIQLLQLIADTSSDHLERLSITRWYQPGNQHDFEDDKKLKAEDLNQIQLCLSGLQNQQGPPKNKFIKLEKLSFCPTWFNFQIQREVIDDQNDQAIAVTGNRDLEMIFFNLRQTLKEIHLGEWAYDDLLTYIAEICKQIEVIEINSTKISDVSILQVFRKCKNLKVIDLSGCQSFLGTAFADAVIVEDGIVTQNIASDSIRKIILGSNFTSGHAMKSAKERIHKYQPNVIFDLNNQKKYSEHIFQN